MGAAYTALSRTSRDFWARRMANRWARRMANRRRLPAPPTHMAVLWWDK